MKKVVVGISGFSGAGKTTFAHALREYLNAMNVSCDILSFSTPLYQALAEMDTERDWVGYKKNIKKFGFVTSSKFSGNSVKFMLTTLADAVKLVTNDDSYFAHLGVSAIKKSKTQVIIFDDLRYEEELNNVLFDVLIRVERADVEAHSNHSSEQPLFLYGHAPFIVKVDDASTDEALIECVNPILGLLHIYHRDCWYE